MASIAVVNLAAPGSTGNQSYTVSGFGTPVAALFYATSGTTLDTDAAGMLFSVGATDLTREVCLQSQSEDAQGTSDVDNGVINTACVSILTKGSATADGVATINGTVTDGLQINWTNVPSSQYLVTCVLFGGDITSAYCNFKALGNTVQVVDITDPGFQPNTVVAFAGDGRAINSTSAGLRNIIGFAQDNGVSVDQGCLWWYDRNNRGTTQLRAAYRGTSLLGAYNNTPALDWHGDAQDFDSSGFSVNVQNAGANNAAMCYLCLDAPNAAVNIFDSGTGTGTEAYTCGFTPEGVLSIGTRLTAAAPTSTGATAESYSLGCTTGTGASDEYCAIAHSDDAVGTTNTIGRTDTKIIGVHDGTGLQTAATLSSFDASGYTFNYSANATADSIHIDLAIAGDSGTTLTPSAVALTISAVAPTVGLGTLTITPNAVAVTIAVAAPTVSLGALTITPSAVALTISAAAPTVGFGVLALTPDAAALTISAVAPTLVFGGIALTPDAVALTISVAAPTVSVGGTTLTPSAVALTISAVAPTVTLGALAITPSAVAVTISAVAPTLAFGGISLTPDAATLTISVAAPTVSIAGGTTTITPDAVALTISVLTIDIFRSPPIIYHHIKRMQG